MLRKKEASSNTLRNNIIEFRKKPARCRKRVLTPLACFDPNTKLLEASARGYPEVVKDALERGASIHARNDYGWTALAIAAMNNRIGVAEFLIERGIELDSRGRPMGFSPLMWASMKGYTEMTLLLLKHGADADLTDSRDMCLTSLILAAVYNHPEVVRELVKTGADVNAADSDGRTALIHAARYNLIEVAGILLEAGADISIKEKSGFTAYAIAEFMGFSEMMRLIKKHSEVG